VKTFSSSNSALRAPSSIRCDPVCGKLSLSSTYNLQLERVDTLEVLRLRIQYNNLKPRSPGKNKATTHSFLLFAHTAQHNLFHHHFLPFLSSSSYLAMSKDPTAIRQALERARNCEDGSVDAQTTALLEAAITELWTRIQRDPDTYVLTRDEFALFNYFLERYRGSIVAQQAVARFWNSYGSPNADLK
jgi:hypothetical protein